MYKQSIIIGLAMLMWGLPVQSKAALQAEAHPGASLERAGFEVIPASARFSIHSGGAKGTFAHGRFGRPGFHPQGKIGGRGFYPYGRGGVYPYRPYKYGGLHQRYPSRYNQPFFYQDPFLGRGGFKTDRYLYDRYSGFNRGHDLGSPFYTPFGTRRPGW